MSAVERMIAVERAIVAEVDDRRRNG